MSLQQVEIDIINEAKNLWIENVQKKFIEGRKARFNLFNPIWEDGTYINIGNDICPMCREYLKKDGNCKNCLFIRILGKLCIDSGGRNFCRKPNLESCNKFIENFDIMLKG
jgi:hypothetical protein